MKRRRWFLLSCLLATSSFAAAPTLPEILANMEKADQNIQTIHFNLHQDIVFTQAAQNLKVQAEAWFGTANRLRIQKHLPDQQLTVSDGKTVWVFNPKPNQVWKGSLQSWLKTSLMQKSLVPLNGYVQALEKNFDLRLMETTDETVTLMATPKDQRLGFNFQLTISTATWLPTKTLYVSDSARVNTALSDVTVNPADASRQFQFAIPKGATVIPLN